MKIGKKIAAIFLIVGFAVASAILNGMLAANVFGEPALAARNAAGGSAAGPGSNRNLIRAPAGTGGINADRNLSRTAAAGADRKNARCSADPLFTVPPLDFNAFTNIIPLGNLNPPGHTLPTDHIYFLLKTASSATPPASSPQVKAPGNITVTGISESSNYENGVLKNVDYSVEFSSCREVSGKFGHLGELSPQLSAAASRARANCNEYASGIPGQIYKFCAKTVNVEMNAAAVMGRAGSAQSAALDWWLYDTRNPRLDFANPRRYFDSIFAIGCPLDYFSAEIKNNLKLYLGDFSMHRTAEPVCGKVMQDMKGTLQGAWFTDNAMDAPGGWEKSLALVADNVDPTLAAISVGGAISSPGVWTFSPREFGATNIDFKAVTPSTTIYCYQANANDSRSRSTKTDGHFLIQLVDERTLKIEQQDGACAGDYFFRNPKIYVR